MKGKPSYLIIGFITGVVYVAACGGASSLGDVASAAAETIGNAIDIVFDNSSSGLSATTVQGAIDEVREQFDGSQASDDYLEGRLIGTWSGILHKDRDYTGESFEMTFNSDGSYTCTVDPQYYGCGGNEGGWENHGGILLLKNSGFDDYADFFVIKKLTNSNLVLVTANQRLEFLELEKQ